MNLLSSCFSVRNVLFACLLICTTPDCFAQHTTADSFYLKKRKGLKGKIIESLFRSVPTEELQIASIKNTSPFIIYKGAIIRNIVINKIDYGNSISDTSRRWEALLDNITRSLHNETRNATIIKNLFFKSGDSIQPFLLADNERFLRSLPFIQDAKIMIKELDNNTDSVDLIVLFKEVFPLGFNLEAQGAGQFLSQISDDNIKGSGDHIMISNYTDIKRTPGTGWGMEYAKNNIKGTFLNIIAGISNFNGSINNGSKQELHYFTSFDLPLVSSYRCLTGNITLASHQNRNRYFSDSLYYSDLNYYYKQMDGWIGYNLSANAFGREKFKRLKKYFIAFRANYKSFEDQPYIYKNKYNYLYANSLDLLVTATMFKQEFYKTSFIYGFGRNEDIPEGINASFTTGWTNKYGLERYYSGVAFQKTYLNKKGVFFDYELRGGAYFDKGNIEDANILLSADIFSKLYHFPKSHWLMRHFISASITKQYMLLLNQPVLLNSSFGLPPLVNPDSFCNTRVTANFQTVFFNTYSFAGFRFAPFAFGNICYVRTKAASFKEGDGYTAFGFGVRSRNESLIFGTMELKFAYYPRTTYNNSNWNIGINTGLFYRYNSQYIKKPDFIYVN